MSRFDIACVLALVLGLFARPVAAQDSPLAAAAPPPAHLAFVDGGVDLIREGVTEPASELMLIDGDVVRTGNGRAELVFADGSVLHLNHDTELELLAPLRLRLASGRVLLRVSAAATSAYVIDAQAATVRLFARGEYDVSADRRSERIAVAVVRGQAEVDDGANATLVHGGEMASIAGAGGRILVETFNTARFDAFESWSSDRINGFAASPSAPYVPSELHAYSALFDDYGRWDYVAPYGNVWFPAVGAAWRPYYAGAWSLTRHGWTWFGHDRWAWPTHHYGRWGYTGASWYWIPHRAWGPAWVSWAFVPGYVSWAPLGWDNRAAIGWHRAGDHPAYWPHYDPYRAWTVIPRHAFGNRRAVRRHALDADRLPDDARRAMANVTRGTTAAMTPGSIVVPSNNVAVPRTTPANRGARSNPDVWGLSRRGNVRSPNAAPTPPAVDPPSIDAPPAAAPGSGAVERRPTRDPYTSVPRAYPPGTYTPRTEPTRASGEERRRRDPRAERPAAARPESSGPSGERARPADRSEAGRTRAGGMAVPRSGAEPAQAAPASQGGAQGGAARRRPPR